MATRLCVNVLYVNLTEEEKCLEEEEGDLDGKTFAGMMMLQAREPLLVVKKGNEEEQEADICYSTTETT